LTVVKNKKKRDTQDAVFGCQHRVCINVYFCNPDLSF
jgi:hypothetical protein